uniref:Ras-associating domain-containing protein n=1 Tax=Mesocestoides corti TaxID=53468 RepID=A0A5K3FSM0_MESCO
MMYDIPQKIDDWNRNALELFRITQPNENQEFFGVVRFYFYGPNDKFYSKCVRISSQSTARHLVNVLVEKFHPDLRLLKSGRYALYEFHPSTGERRLSAEERPLMTQINWRSHQREGRFILRDESKLDTKNFPNRIDTSAGNMMKWRSAGNLMTSPGSNSPDNYDRMRATSLKQPPAEPFSTSRNPSSSLDELVFEVPSSKKNKKDKPLKKKKTPKPSKKAKLQKNGKVERDGSWDEDIVRTASLPNGLDENDAFAASNRGPIDSSSGTLTVFLKSANLPDPSQTLKSTLSETSAQVIRRILSSYDQPYNPDFYSLEQINVPAKGESLPYSVPPHRFLRSDEKPLRLIRTIQSTYPQIHTELHLTLHRDESLSLQDDSSPNQDYVNLSFNRGKVKRTIPRLVEVNPDGTAKSGKTLRFNLDGLIQPERDKQKGGTPIKVGSQFSAVGPPPNIVLSSNRFPDIRPVHCSLLPASMTSSTVTPSGGTDQLPTVLISPALDITTRPPGPTLVCVDGKKVVRPTGLRHGAIIQLGRTLYLKFVEQSSSLDKTRPLAREHSPKGSMPDLDIQAGGRARSPDKQFRNRSSRNQPTYENTDQLFLDRIPLIVDVCLPESGHRTWNNRSKEDFAAFFHETCCDTVDTILKLACSLSNNSTVPIGEVRANRNARPPLFVLTPSFLLYALLRCCLRRWKAVQLTTEQKDHYLAGILNHIGNQMFQCIQTSYQNDINGWQPIRVVFNRLLFWLANSSEFLNFIRNDADLAEAATKSDLLSSCIDAAFHELRKGFLEYMKYLTPSLLFPGDYDQQDDLRMDDRPVPPPDELPHPQREDPNIQRLIQSLSYMMLGMRQACVNVSFALQFYAYVFHAIGAWVFNSIVQGDGGGRGGVVGKKTPTKGGGMWVTKLGAGRLMRRLQRVNQWASRHGLGTVCEVHLLLPIQTCQLITSDRSKFRPYHRRILEMRSLNSAKIEWLLTHLGDPPPVPTEWVNKIILSVRQEIDREIMEKHGSPSSRETRELLSLQEPVDLDIPLIIPLDGYAATTGLKGVPEGFMEAIEPLVEDGCIFVRRNEAAFSAPLNGAWTGHFMNRKTLQDGKKGVKASTLPAAAANANIERLAREAGVKLSSVKRIVLEKNGQPLGLGIVAAKPEGNAPYGIYIRHIVPGSVSASDGRLETGDQILAIANSSLVNCDQSEAAVAILARISNEVHLVIAKRAAQARGIITLINSAERGGVTPPPFSTPYQSTGALTRSTPCLIQPARPNGSSDDDDDDSETGGPQFGSRVSLSHVQPLSQPQKKTQLPIYRPKSVEALSQSRPNHARHPTADEFEVTSEDEEDEVTSNDDDDDGSDEVWQPPEVVSPTAKQRNHRPSPPNGQLSFQPSPASFQGSLSNYKFRSQQDLRPSAIMVATPKQQQPTVTSTKNDDDSESPDWTEYAKRNAEVIKNQGGKQRDVETPSLASISSSDSIISQRDNNNLTSPSAQTKAKNVHPGQSVLNSAVDGSKTQDVPPEGVYATPSEATTESEEILEAVKHRIPAHSRKQNTSVDDHTRKKTSTAEKMTSPLNGSPAKEVTDKAMQTVVDASVGVRADEAPAVSVQASAVQTEPAGTVETPRVPSPELVSRYTPPLDRLPITYGNKPAASRPVSNPAPVRPVQVEDVTKSAVGSQYGRSYQPSTPRSFETKLPPPPQPPSSSTAPYSELHLPWGGQYPSAKPLSQPPQGSAESVLPVYRRTNQSEQPSTIQSGVTYWSSQSNLAAPSQSPPPRPTADFPQYHPPASLEPSDLAKQLGDTASPHLVYGPPASHYVPRRSISRENSPLRVDLIERSRSLSSSTHGTRTSSLNRTPQPHAPDSQSETLQELAREIRLLEEAVAANPSTDLVRELDRLRVEYRFQVHMNDRSRTRSLNAPLLRSGDVATGESSIPKVQPPVMPKPKPRPLVPNLPTVTGTSSTRPLDELENERLELIRIREQRERIYDDTLNLKPTVDFSTPATASLSITSTTPVPPMQPRYTYQVESGPLYEDTLADVRTTNQVPRYSETTRRLPSPDPLLARGSELRASRKSVTFDTNLESVAVYSPPASPRPDHTRRVVPKPINGCSNERTTQPPANGKQALSSTGVRVTPSTISQPENAENLSFMDKMAFFAQAIGEEMPKDRPRISQRERQLLHNLAH